MFKLIILCIQLIFTYSRTNNNSEHVDHNHNIGSRYINKKHVTFLYEKKRAHQTCNIHRGKQTAELLGQIYSPCGTDDIYHHYFQHHDPPDPHHIFIHLKYACQIVLSLYPDRIHILDVIDNERYRIEIARHQWNGIIFNTKTSLNSSCNQKKMRCVVIPHFFNFQGCIDNSNSNNNMIASNNENDAYKVNMNDWSKYDDRDKNKNDDDNNNRTRSRSSGNNRSNLIFGKKIVFGLVGTSYRDDYYASTLLNDFHEANISNIRYESSFNNTCEFFQSISIAIAWSTINVSTYNPDIYRLKPSERFTNPIIMNIPTIGFSKYDSFQAYGNTFLCDTINCIKNLSNFIINNDMTIMNQFQELRTRIIHDVSPSHIIQLYNDLFASFN